MPSLMRNNLFYFHRKLLAVGYNRRVFIKPILRPHPRANAIPFGRVALLSKSFPKYLPLLPTP